MTAYREFNPPCSRGAATPATGRALLLAFVLASLSGCDSLIGVADSPSRIVAEDAELPVNASLMVTGTIADFECAFTRYIAAQGLVGDELMWASTSPWGREFDRREFSPSEGFYATQTCDQLWSPAVYKPLSTARWQADNALNLIDEWTDSEVPERTSLIATAAAYSGYAHTLIGEGMCSAAFDLGPEIGPAEIMERALARRNLSTTVRHFANQVSEPSFPWPSAPSPGSAPSTSLTGSARLIQTSALSSAARGGPATKRSGRAA